MQDWKYYLHRYLTVSSAKNAGKIINSYANHPICMILGHEYKKMQNLKYYLRKYLLFHLLKMQRKQ